MQPNFAGLRPRRVQKVVDKTTAFSYNNVDNGAIVYQNDNSRKRSGGVEHEQYVAKVSGAIELAAPSGATGSVKGGMVWVAPDPSSSDRVKVIYAVNNDIRLYSVANETDVLLRDVNTEDGYSISFLSGEQPVKKAYFAIGDSTTSTNLFTYNGTQTGSVTAVADNGSGKAEFTSASHGITDGQTVTLSGFSESTYNVSGIASGVTTNTFDISTITYVSDVTGTWSADIMAVESKTALNAARLLGTIENRLVSTGTGDDANKGQYSHAVTTGLFTTFAVGLDEDSGGLFSGVQEDIQAFAYLKGAQYIFERNRITPHVIRHYDESGVGRLKDSLTIVHDGVIEGNGVESSKAVTTYKSSIYFVNSRGIFEIQEDGKMKELTKKFRPLFKGYNFSDASMDVHEENNWLVITCASDDGIGQDTQFIWSFDSNTMSFVSGKYHNQVIWDPINKKMYGMGSTEPKIFEVYPEESYEESDNTKIELSAETRAYNMGDIYHKKSFVSLSVPIAAVHETQVFTVEVYIDDNEESYTSFTRSLTDIITTQGQTMASWGGGAWGGLGGALATNEPYFSMILWRGFVPQFQKIFVRVVEQSPYLSLVGQPMIQWRGTNTKVNSFDSNF